MADNKPQIDFATVLAAAVHDMKNSLCLMMQSIENLSDNLPHGDNNVQRRLADVHYESSRLNTGLVQLLSLFRSELDALPVNIDECFLDDLMDELVASNHRYAQQKDIEIDVNVEPDLCWYLDFDLVYMLLNDVLINAMRYGKSAIRLSASSCSDGLHITIEDDGPGYPEGMLEAQDIHMQDVQIRQGRTGLGLFFARLIANTHSRNGIRGKIELSNGGSLGGSVFKLNLP
ncbi:sensor histidine kinase [Aestuariibacter salexigens]|uniref:sensor histidine kinase n=1 Tax=Aestuariibacter salexigens TaxID=226010 RepID=UPI00047E9162|nr:HAMP domain-containing sensor histidine kinase [Aestuariibacter salexigens]